MMRHAFPVTAPSDEQIFDQRSGGQQQHDDEPAAIERPFQPSIIAENQEDGAEAPLHPWPRLGREGGFYLGTA